MEETELTQTIRDYIKTLYKAEYTGRLEVEKDENGYKFIIGLPSYMSPTTISSNHSSDEEFLEYIYEELRKRNYMRLYIYKVIRENDSREQ